MPTIHVVYLECGHQRGIVNTEEAVMAFTDMESAGDFMDMGELVIEELEKEFQQLAAEHNGSWFQRGREHIPTYVPHPAIEKALRDIGFILGDKTMQTILDNCALLKQQGQFFFYYDEVELVG